ncbi:sororin [Pelodytes ibericus]
MSASKKRGSVTETERETCTTSPLNRQSKSKLSSSNVPERTSPLNRRSKSKLSSSNVPERTSPLNRRSKSKLSSSNVPERTSPLNRRSKSKLSSSNVPERTSPLNRRSKSKLSSSNVPERTSPLNRRSKSKLSSSNVPERTSPLNRRSKSKLSSSNVPERTSPLNRRSKSKLSSSNVPEKASSSNRRNLSSENTDPESPVPVRVVRRPITAKKIMPRKTLAAMATLASLPSPKVSIVTPAPRRSSRVSPKFEKENASIDHPQKLPKGTTEKSPAKIDILSPIPLNISLSPMKDDRDRLMSQKVRRSYSRLEMSLNSSSFLYSPTKKSDSSDTSTPNPLSKSGRRSLFGFNNLVNSETPEEELVKEVKRDLGKNGHVLVNKSVTVTAPVEEPDYNIPGVVMIKQKRRKRKVPMIEKSDLDQWAANMNAEFEEAEKFDLLVE